MVSSKSCRPTLLGENFGAIGPVRENSTSPTSGDFVVISGLSENTLFGQSPILITSPTIKHEAFTFFIFSIESWKNLACLDEFYFRLLEWF